MYSITLMEMLVNQACCLLIYEAPAEVCTCQENNKSLAVMVFLGLSNLCSTKVQPFSVQG